MQDNNAEKLQSVISDDLFPNVAHISDVKQVIEEMQKLSQSLTQNQMKAILYLQQLGRNQYLHGDKDPYKDLVKYLTRQGKIDIANPDYYIDTIEALIPKPPKPIVLAEKAGGKR